MGILSPMLAQKVIIPFSSLFFRIYCIDLSG